MVNDADLADLMKFQEMCASGDCKSMPSKQKMQIKVKISVIYIKNLKLVWFLFDEIMFLQNIQKISLIYKSYLELVQFWQNRTIIFQIDIFYIRFVTTSYFQKGDEHVFR